MDVHELQAEVLGPDDDFEKNCIVSKEEIVEVEETKIICLFSIFSHFLIRLFVYHALRMGVGIDKIFCYF